MQDKIEVAKDIGRLLAAADNLHYFYYDSNDNLSSMPSVLFGGKHLLLILNEPEKGINLLFQRAQCFLDFCKNKIIYDKKDSKRAKICMGFFKSLYNRILCNISNVEITKVDYGSKIILQNIVMLEFLKGTNDGKKKN